MSLGVLGFVPDAIIAVLIVVDEAEVDSCVGFRDKGLQYLVVLQCVELVVAVGLGEVF